MTEKNTYKAQPEELPKPTYWPFFLALGVVLIFWGILTSWNSYYRMDNGDL
jgi:hypothetical protein